MTLSITISFPFDTSNKNNYKLQNQCRKTIQDTDLPLI